MILDKLKVIVQADTSQLRKGMQEAKASVEDLSRSAKQASDAINQSADQFNVSGLTAQLEVEKRQFAELGKQIDATKVKIEELTGKLAEAEAKLNEKGSFGGAFVVLNARNYEEYKAKLEEARQTLMQLETQYENQKKRLAEVSESLRSAKESQKEYTKALKEQQKVQKTVSSSSSGGGFWGSLRKILMVIRSIRYVISMIVMVMREGTQYLAVWDSKLNGIAGYNKAFSQLYSSADKLRYTLSITGAELIEAYGPALSTMMQALQAVVEWLNKMLAALNGRTTYTIVNPEYWKDYAASVQESNNKLKETKTLISGFDELNTLSKSYSGISLPLEDMFISKEIEEGWLKTIAENEWLQHLIKTLMALAALLPLITKLMNWKNKVLGQQTIATKKETGAVSSWVKELGLATLGALGLAGALDKLREKLKELGKQNKDIPDLGQVPVPEPVPVPEEEEQKQPQWEPVPVPALIFDFEEAKQQLEDFREKVKGWAENLGEVLEPVRVAPVVLSAIFAVKIAEIVDNLKRVPQAVSENFGKAKETVTQWGTDIMTWCTEAKQSVLDWATTFSQKVSSAFEEVSGAIASFVENAKLKLTALGTAFTAFVAGLTSGSNNNTTKPDAETNGSDSSLRQILNKLTFGMLYKDQTVASTGWSPSMATGSTETDNAYQAFRKSTTAQESWLSSVASEIKAKLVQEAMVTTASVGLVMGTIYEILKNRFERATAYGFANGGVLTKPTLGLLAEYSNAKSNPEVIAPKSVIMEAMNESNGEVVNTLIQVGRQIIQAIESKEVDISIGDMQIAQACSRGNKSYQRMTGMALI